MQSILVTGGNRTGTSWMGRMLSLSGEIYRVWESFNHLITLPGIFPESPLERHYQRILPKQKPAMRKFIRNKCIMDLIHGADGNRTLSGSSIHKFRQDSGSLADACKNSLGKDEIEKVRNITYQVCDLFSRDESWPDLS